jgi:hypothetical protein
MYFALKKYKLVYFSCNRKDKFNLKAEIQLDKTKKEPTQDVYILRV